MVQLPKLAGLSIWWMCCYKAVLKPKPLLWLTRAQFRASSLSGAHGWYCHGLSWKWVPNALEDEEKQTPFWATCQGLLILERESAPWKVTATNISQWYLDSSRKPLGRLLYYFLTPSVLSVFPSPFWINNVCFKYNYSSASGYLYPEVSSNFPGAQRAHGESLPAQSWDDRFCGCNAASFRFAVCRAGHVVLWFYLEFETASVSIHL